MLDTTITLPGSDIALRPLLAAAKDGTNAPTIRALVMKLLSHPDIFCGYDQVKAAIQASAKSASAVEPKILNTLDLFSYGTFQDYHAASTEHYITLTDAQLAKLKQLTVISLVEKACLQKSPILSYSTVQEALKLQKDVTSIRHVEQVILSCLYARVFSGRLCQETQALHLSSSARVYPRDVPKAAIPQMMALVRAFQAKLDSADHELENKKSAAEAESNAEQVFLQQLHEQRKKKAENASSAARLGVRGPVGVEAMDLSGSRTPRRQKRTRGGLSGLLDNSGTSHFQS